MQFENFTSITKRPVSVLEKCFRRIFEVASYQGTRLRVPYSKEKDEGFSSCFMAKPAAQFEPGQYSERFTYLLRDVKNDVWRLFIANRTQCGAF